jgi:hypothetical protein
MTTNNQNAVNCSYNGVNMRAKSRGGGGATKEGKIIFNEKHFS